MMGALSPWCGVALALLGSLVCLARAIQVENVDVDVDLEGLELSPELVVESLDRDDQGEYVCVCMDYRPSNKCDYGVCPWGNASVLTQDLDDERLLEALKALSPIRIRVGGYLTDQVTYEDRGKTACKDFEPPPPTPSGLFRGGCLTLKRWDEINHFCNKKRTGCELVFALNAMHGRTYQSAWDSSNAEFLIRYTSAKGYDLFAYELGNELGLDANTFAESYRELYRIIHDAYEGKDRVPVLIGPDAISWDDEFMNGFLPLVKDILHAVSWHSYPLGPGYNNPSLDVNIMSPSKHDQFYRTAQRAVMLTAKLAPNTAVWMGETGGSYNSGHNGTSNTFIDGFWFADVLAGISHSGHKTFCRQTFIGGNYELIDKATLEPNPDYYVALLYKKLMGSKVYGAVTEYGDNLRTWKSSSSHHDTFLYLNYNGESSYLVNATIPGSRTRPIREEYHLTAESLHSRKVYVNGKRPRSPKDAMQSVKFVNASSSLRIPPYSIVFVRYSKYSL